MRCRHPLIALMLAAAALPCAAQNADTRFGTWNELAPFLQVGRVLDGVNLPGGGYRMLDAGGVVWLGPPQGALSRPLNDARSLRSLGGGSLLQLPGTPPRLLVSADRPAGVHYSDDDGATWRAASGLDGAAQMPDLGLEASIDGTRVFHLRQTQAVGQAGAPLPQLALSLSSDRGASFAAVGLLPFHSAMDAQPAGSDFYLLRENRLARIDASGTALSEVGAVPIDFALSAIRGVGVCAGGNGNSAHVYAFYLVGSDAAAEVRVYRSLDGGLSWLRRTSIPADAPARLPVQCSSRDPAIALVGGERAWRSHDGGASWQAVGQLAGPGVDPFFVLPPGTTRIRRSFADSLVERFLFATSAGLFVSDNAGISVSAGPSFGLKNTQFLSLASLAETGEQLAAAVRDRGYQRLDVNGAQAEFATLRAAGAYSRVAPGSGGGLWLAGAREVLLDIAPQASSNPIVWRLPGEMRPDGEISLLPLPGDPDRAWLGGVRVDGRVAIVELRFDGSALQPRVLAQAFGDAPIVAMAAASGRFYAADAAGRFYRSADGGASFATLAGGQPVAAGVQEILADPAVPGRLLLAGAGGTLGAVRESLDDGASFRDLASGLPGNTQVHALAISADGLHLFAATADGPYYFERAQQRWRHIGAAQAPDQAYRDVEYVERIQRARFASDGRGVWQLQLLAPPPAGALLDEPQTQAYTPPPPGAPQFGCPAGFYIAEVTDGPGDDVRPGSFGVEVLLEAPGTRLLAGGLNFGGLVDEGQPGFAGFSVVHPRGESQPVQFELRAGSIAGADSPLRVRVTRRSASGSQLVYESTPLLSLQQATRFELNLPPGFYEASVATPNCCSQAIIGGAPEAQFYFGITTQGGGFEGGAVVGGYHARVPGLVSGFAAFCLADPHALSLRTLSAPSYGVAGARDLRLQLRDGNRRTLVSLPPLSP